MITKYAHLRSLCGRKAASFVEFSMILFALVLVSVAMISVFSGPSEGSDGEKLTVAEKLFGEDESDSSQAAPVEEPAEEAPVEENSPQEAPPAAEEPAPSEPTDFSGVLMALGVLGSLVLLGAFTWLMTVMVKSLKTSRQEKADMLGRLEAVKTRHGELNTIYSQYLFDVRSVLKKPALNDPTIKETAKFLEDYALLPDLNNFEMFASEDNIKSYGAKVSDAWSSWRAAEARAQKLGLSNFSIDEIKQINRAQALLNIALNDAASEAERQSAYTQAKKLLEGLIHVPEQAIAAIEKKGFKAIEAAPIKTSTSPTDIGVRI